MSDAPFRHRKAYGETFRKIISELYGLGIDPGSLIMERNTEEREGDKGLARARFNIVQRAGDEEFMLFEGKTSDELNLIAEGIEQTKQLFSYFMKDNGIADPEVLLRMFTEPNAVSVKLSVQGSFDEDFANLIVPEVANQNRPMQRAASTQSYQGKNPKKVEAGRRAAAVRWGKRDDEKAAQ